MTNAAIPGGTIHNMPADLQKALTSHAEALAAWNDITPLARNEWICWVEGAKLIDTRSRRVERAHNELAEGKRRPCCWPGCIHRTDIPLSPTKQWLINKQAKAKQAS